MQKLKFLIQEEKEKLSAELINLGWNEINFCICDKRSIYGLFTILKIDMMPISSLDIKYIEDKLNVTRTKITAEGNSVILEWI